MNIEIVEAYPYQAQNKRKTYSLHVYLIDYGIDLRGVLAIQHKDNWIIKMPYRIGFDEETKKKVPFPVFSFIDREKYKLLIKEIQEKTKIFLNNFLKKS